MEAYQGGVHTLVRQGRVCSTKCKERDSPVGQVGSQGNDCFKAIKEEIFKCFFLKDVLKIMYNQISKGSTNITIETSKRHRLLMV